MSSNRYPDPPPWPIYEATRELIVSVVAPPDAAAADQRVPLTPAWSTVDVVAHLCGLTTDVAAGVRTGLGTPERTRHQVESRRGRTIEDIVGEWRSNDEAMRAAFDDDPFFGHRLTADATVHLHDLQHALGDEPDRGNDATRCGAHTYGSVVTDLLLERTGVALRVELTDGSTFAPSARRHTDLTVIAAPYDWLRTVTGRRSRREALGLGWSDEPTRVLDDLCPYGPLRADDADF